MLSSLGTQPGEDVNSNNIDGAVDEDGNKQQSENNHTCIEMDDEEFVQTENNREQGDHGDDHTNVDCDTVDGSDEDGDGEGIKRALVSETGAGSSSTLTKYTVTTAGSSSTVATITPSNSTNSGQHS